MTNHEHPERHAAGRGGAGGELGPRPLCRNVMVSGRRTSVRMEPVMWQCLDEICKNEDVTLGELCSLIEQAPNAGGLTASLRVFVVAYLRELVRLYEDTLPPPAGLPGEPRRRLLDRALGAFR